MIVNELLCYTIHHMNSSAPENIKRILNSFYSAKEIIDAKKLLWTECKDNLEDYQNRNSTSTRTAAVASIEDIFGALMKLDAGNNTPIVYAKDLNRVPDRQPEELNYAMLIQKVATLNRYKIDNEQVVSKLAADILELQDVVLSRTNSAMPDRNYDNSNESNDANETTDSEHRNDNQHIQQETITDTEIIAENGREDEQQPIDAPQDELINNPEIHDQQSNEPTGAAQPINQHIDATDNTENDLQNIVPEALQTAAVGLQTTPATQHTTPVIPQTPTSALQPSPPIQHTTATTPLTPALRPQTPPQRQRTASEVLQSPAPLRGRPDPRPLQTPADQLPSGQRQGNDIRRPLTGDTGHNYRPRQHQQRRSPPVVDADGFTLVQNRRRVIGNNSTTHGNLRGALPPTRQLFVSRVTHGNERDIYEYIESKHIEPHNVESMSHEHSKYKSFKVTISVLDKNTMLTEKFWPNGVQCMMWRYSRRSYSDSSDHEQQYDRYDRYDRYDPHRRVHQGHYQHQQYS